MRSPADAALRAVWMDPPGWTTNVRADAAGAPSRTARVMKKHMIFLQAGMHTSACAEGDKVACVIDRVVARVGSSVGQRPTLTDPRQAGELRTWCSRWMMSSVEPRPATLDLAQTASSKKRVRRMTEKAACCWRNGVSRAIVRGRGGGNARGAEERRQRRR